MSSIPWTVAENIQGSLHITVLGFILHIVHRELTERTIVNEINLEGDEQNPSDHVEPGVHGGVGA